MWFRGFFSIFQKYLNFLSHFIFMPKSKQTKNFLILSETLIIRFFVTHPVLE